MLKLKEKSQEWWHVKLGTALIVCGIAIVKPPGFSDALLSFVNKKYVLGMPLYPSTTLGLALLVLGVGVIVLGEWMRREKRPAPMMVFRHQSLGSFVTPLSAEDLPPRS